LAGGAVHGDCHTLVVSSPNVVMRHVTVPYGPPAQEALARVVDAAKGDDPLAPVSVVVAANSVGVAARRALGRRAGGVIGVQFLTVYRLAELLGAPTLAGVQRRRPVSTPVLAAAARATLRETRTIFDGVREHAATEEALIAAHRLLADCSDAALDAIAACGRRASDVVRVHRAMRDRLAPGWFDEHDLMDAAIGALTAGAPVAEVLGVTIIHLPQPMSRPQQQLLRALGRAHEVVVIEGDTGVAEADAGVRDTVTALLGHATDRSITAARPAATLVRSLSDADEEARAAVRDVVTALHDGTPIDRIAVLYSAREPYARLLHEHCAAAGLVMNGASVRTLADSMAGRFLLRLLALPDRDFGRAEVCEWLAGAPVRDGRRLATTARWEAITRRAGIVHGDDWERGLGAYITTQEREAAREHAVPDREPNPARFESEAEGAVALRAFVRRVRAALAVRPRSWKQHVEWVRALVRDFLGGEPIRSRWPDREQRAATAIEAALDRLAALDDIDPTLPSREVFRRTLELELDTDLGREGRQGVGVLVAPLSFGLGLDVDRVIIVGAAEGLLPARRLGDALLPDDDRAAAGGELPLVADAVHDDDRALLAAMAASRGSVTLSWPRGDLRRTTELRPSRFLLDALGALTGRRYYASDLATDLHEPWFDAVPSFLAGVTRAVVPATEQDHRLRALAAGTSCDDRDGRYARGVECVQSRASRRFTRFDGNVTARAALVPGPARDHQPISATALQDWATNPFEYFVAKVLGAQIPQAPEERFEISPLDRGSLVHAILEHWLLERIDAGAVPAPAEPWSNAARARLLAIAEADFGEHERLGLTGRSVFWRRDRLRIIRDLELLLDADDVWRQTTRATPCAAELGFGVRHSARPPVAMTLADGRVVHLRGSADRVDVADDGTIHVVDYKTGKPNGYSAISEADPDQHGTRLQLPVYALAARAALGSTATPVCAAYWFVTDEQSFKRVELPLTDAVDARFDAVVTEIVDGIEVGVFPCRPGEEKYHLFRDRTHTDPDALGTRDLARAWTRKHLDPRLTRYCALAGEAAADEATADA
jgi:hypothetical protein